MNETTKQKVILLGDFTTREVTMIEGSFDITPEPINSTGDNVKIAFSKGSGNSTYYAWERWAKGKSWSIQGTNLKKLLARVVELISSEPESSGEPE